MTTQPSDWAVARAFWEVVMNGTGGLQGPYLIGRIELRASELDASRDVLSLEHIIGSMRNFADVADDCPMTENNAPAAIRAWADMLDATPRAAEAGDTERLDWLVSQIRLTDLFNITYPHNPTTTEGFRPAIDAAMGSLGAGATTQEQA